MNTNQENEILEFWSNDHRFGLNISLLDINRMILACVSSYPNETGGVLIGYYNEKLNYATVTEIFYETSDSQKGKTWFFRGIHGLQDKLSKLWVRQRAYYLGEWHFHPEGRPAPSQVDINQMLDIASSAKSYCPEPILLMFAGTNDHQKILHKPYVFSKGQVYELMK